jgi:gamma-glutamyltranspeptidase
MHTTRDSNTLTSGLSIIHVDGDRLVGGADKRRDGTVAGR